MKENSPLTNPEKYKERLKLDNDIFEGEDNRRGRPEYFMPPGTEVLKLQEFLEIDLGRKSKNGQAKWIQMFFALSWNAITTGILVFAISTMQLWLILFTITFMSAGLMLLLQTSVNKYFTGTVINGKRIMSYSLSAITKDNVSIRLVDESNLDTVLYLEQEIERFLDITDRPVKNEILNNER